MVSGGLVDILGIVYCGRECPQGKGSGARCAPVTDHFFYSEG